MLIPVILFTVAEEWGGLVWALVLSVLYAVGEILWEWVSYRKVAGLTLFSNGMVVGLSVISYYTQDGFWFKLQPALLEMAMAAVLLGTSFLGRPLLLTMLEQQKTIPSPEMEVFFRGLNKRMGAFFLFQAALAAYAGFYWSTEVWAFLKSVGVLLMMVLYMLIEIYFLRRRQARVILGAETKGLAKEINS